MNEDSPIKGERREIPGRPGEYYVYHELDVSEIPEEFHQHFPQTTPEEIDRIMGDPEVHRVAQELAEQMKREGIAPATPGGEG